MKFWWQRNKETPGVKGEADPAPNDASTPCPEQRILDEAGLLGAFAWEWYRKSGRGLIFLKLADLEDLDTDLKEKLEYFTLAELDNLGEDLLQTLEGHVGSYSPETDFVVAIFGDSLDVRVVELNTPLADL